MNKMLPMLRIVLLSLICLSTSSYTHAKEATPMAENLEVEKRMMNLGAELRCLVCQNQTIADSHADLAKDLKREIREQIKLGKTDAEIKAFMVERYGDFILYKPAYSLKNTPLWIGPGLLLIIALIILVKNIRSRQKAIIDTPLSESERARIDALVKNKD